MRTGQNFTKKNLHKGSISHESIKKLKLKDKLMKNKNKKATDRG